MIAALHKPKAESRKPKATTGFTLTELLVAMAIIGIIAAITVVGVGTLARDAKLASATNTVIAGLDTARGIAIRDNKLTVLVFRPRVDGSKQYVELVIAQWTGQSQAGVRVDKGGGDSYDAVIDRFIVVPGIAARRLPSGIKIAGPGFGSDDDQDWNTVSHFPAVTEAPGRMLGVMFAGNGTVVTRNAVMDSHALFIDINLDNMQDHACPDVAPPNPFNFENPPDSLPTIDDDFVPLFGHFGVESEPFVDLIPFLAIFDDDRCRAEYDVSEWNDPAIRTANYTQYITNNADRIHFNRYTGVVMR